MRPRMVMSGLILILAGLAATRAVWADVVELKTGERVEGTVREATPAGVVIEIGGQEVTLKLGHVRAIYFGGDPSQPATSATPLPPEQLEATRARALARDAVDALREMQSIAVIAGTFQSYSSALSATKIRVDRYRRASFGTTPELDDAISSALGLYLIASLAWSNESERDYRFPDLGYSPTPIDVCPDAKRVATSYEGSLGGVLPGDLRLYRSYVNACASEKVRKAERILRSTAPSSK